jgi:Flp pilus assembly protein TadD
MSGGVQGRRRAMQSENGNHVKGMRGREAAKLRNLVVLRRDAAYFIERANAHLQAYNYGRALRAFQRTVKLEPDNPQHRWNVAQCLTEMGDFEGANRVLEGMLRELGSASPEIRYHMALNYLAMDDYEEAQRLLVEYLDTGADDERAQQAEALLCMLAAEIGETAAFRGWVKRTREKEMERARRDGRLLMQQGRYAEAADQMEALLPDDPDNTALCNNLSVASWHAGRYGRAIELAERVLAKEPDNVHALCNLTLFRAKVGPRDAYLNLLQRLRKLFPLQYEQAMKVGTTLGVLGEHRAALLVFYRLLRFVHEPDAPLYYSAAAAAANCGRLGWARQWWRMLATFPGMEGIAAYYLRASERARQSGRKSLRVSYQYVPPVTGHDVDLRKRLNLTHPDRWRDNPVWHASVQWGLRHGWKETQRAAIRALALIGDKQAEAALRDYLKRPDIRWPEQAAALFALQRMGARGRVEVYRDGALRTWRMGKLPKDLVLHADPMWLEIWQRTEAWLKSQRKGRYVAEARRAWLAYLQYVFTRTDFKVHKPDVWCAGLVYATLRHHNEPVRQRDIAEALGVSVSSVRKAASRLGPFFVKMPEV